MCFYLWVYNILFFETQCEAWDLEVLLDLFMEYGFITPKIWWNAFNMNICQCVGTYIHSIVAQDSMSKSNVWFWVSQTIRILQFAQIAYTSVPSVPWRWVTPAKRAWTLVSDFCKHQRHNGIGITWNSCGMRGVSENGGHKLYQIV